MALANACDRLTDERGIYGKLLADLGLKSSALKVQTATRSANAALLCNPRLALYRFGIASLPPIGLSLKWTAQTQRQLKHCKRWQKPQTLFAGVITAIRPRLSTSRQPSVPIPVWSLWKCLLSAQRGRGQITLPGHRCRSTGRRGCHNRRREHSAAEELWLNFMISGAYVAIAALSALHHQRHTGQGQRTTCPCMSIASCLEQVFMFYFYQQTLNRPEGRVLPRRGALHWSDAYSVMPGKNGCIMATPAPNFDNQLMWWIEEDVHEEPDRSQVHGTGESATANPARHGHYESLGSYQGCGGLVS